MPLPVPAGRDGASKRSYEEVNGPVPRVDIFDENGLAQQTSGPPRGPRPAAGGAAAAALADFDLDPATMSNVGPEMVLAVPGFAEAAAQGAAGRLAQGFAADGSLGGPFSEHQPPEGKEFGGFLKGHTGIVWKPKP
jgi:hypothetical protein